MLASATSDRKGTKNSSWYFMILPKNNCFQNIKIKLNSTTWMTLMSSLVIFKALEPLQPQWPLQPQQPPWPQWPQRPFFLQKIGQFYFTLHPIYQNKHVWIFLLNILTKTLILLWFDTFQSEAAEATWGNCFKKLLVWNKFPLFRATPSITIWFKIQNWANASCPKYQLLPSDTL